MPATKEIRLHQHLNLKASRTALYNPDYSRVTPRVGLLCSRVMNVLIPYLELPSDTKVIVKPLRGSIQALHQAGILHRETYIEVDPRDKRKKDTPSASLDWNVWLYQIIAHEMVHVKQYLDGRLSYSYDDKLNLVVHWEGTAYPSVPDAEKDWEAYRALPWEDEAWDRMEELAELVVAETNKLNRR